MRVSDRVLLALAGAFGPLVIRGIYMTLKFEVFGAEHLEVWRAGVPAVFVGWHGRLLPLLYLFRGHRIVMLVSRHRDGEYLRRVGWGLGYDAVRGSSSRGGAAALRELVRRVRSGQSVAITPDGPRGPKERFKPGALQVARLTQAPVIPVLAGCQQAWWVEGWDSFMVPRPFATVRVAVGCPRVISRSAGVGELDEQARWLEAEMGELKEQVDGDGSGLADKGLAPPAVGC